MVKAIIPIAGKGTRLLPLTKDTHKSLLKLRGDLSIVEEQIAELKKLGVTDIAVVVGHMKDKIKNTLGDSVIYFENEDYADTNSIVSLWKAKEFFKGDEDVLVFNGDLLVDPKILKELIEKESKFCTVLDIGKWNDDGYKAKVDNNKVILMDMDIPKEEFAGEYAGMSKVGKDMHKDLVEVLDRYMLEKNTGTWYETAFVSLIRAGHDMDFIDTAGRWWTEIDFPHELEAARKHFEKQGAEDEYK